MTMSYCVKCRKQTSDINGKHEKSKNGKLMLKSKCGTCGEGENVEHELNETLNSDLDSLKQWLEGNKLSLNVIKTQARTLFFTWTLQVNNGE